MAVAELGSRPGTEGFVKKGVGIKSGALFQVLPSFANCANHHFGQLVARASKIATSSTLRTVVAVGVEGVESKTHTDGCSCSELTPVEDAVSRDPVGGGQAEEKEDWKISHGRTVGGWIDGWMDGWMDRNRIDREGLLWLSELLEGKQLIKWSIFKDDQ